MIMKKKIKSMGSPFFSQVLSKENPNIKKAANKVNS